jgi:integrase
VLWELRVNTGLRQEEAYGLHVGDIDLNANKIRIERAVSLGRMKDTKTHERQYIDLSDGLVSLLTEYVDFVKAEALLAIFPNPVGYSLVVKAGW